MKSAASVSATGSGKGLNLNENCLKVLENRYLKRNEDGTVIETAVDMFTRVARTIAEADRAYGKSDADVERTATEFYRLMTSLEFLPNSPTLMNAGRELGQLVGLLRAARRRLHGGDLRVRKERRAHPQVRRRHRLLLLPLRPKNDVVKSTRGVSAAGLLHDRVRRGHRDGQAGRHAAGRQHGHPAGRPPGHPRVHHVQAADRTG